MMKKDYNAILGVPANATLRDIKRAYHSLALQFHPDRVPGYQKKEAEEKFKEIVEAYQALYNLKSHEQGRRQSYRDRPTESVNSPADRDQRNFVVEFIKEWLEEIIYWSRWHKDRVIFLSFMTVYIILSFCLETHYGMSRYFIVKILSPVVFFFSKEILQGYAGLSNIFSDEPFGYKILRGFGWLILFFYFIILILRHI